MDAENLNACVPGLRTGLDDTRKFLNGLTVRITCMSISSLEVEKSLRLTRAGLAPLDHFDDKTWRNRMQLLLRF